MMKVRLLSGILAVAGALGVQPSSRAEVIEEIVARVNDDVITRTELQEAEQGAMEEIYSSRSGEELDKELTKAKTELLKDLITKKMLVQQAERLYDLSKMQDAFVRQFKEQQKIATNAELEKVLKDEGLTLDEFKKRLVEINAPNSVIDYEVRQDLSLRRRGRVVLQGQRAGAGDSRSSVLQRDRSAVRRTHPGRDSCARPLARSQGASRRELHRPRQGELPGRSDRPRQPARPVHQGRAGEGAGAGRPRDEAGGDLRTRGRRERGSRHSAREP